MVSGRGNNMRAIINTCYSKKWPIEVIGVISDNECPAINLATSLHIPTWVIDRKKFKNSNEFESELINVVSYLNPCLIALAGFMRILSYEFCKAHSGKLINIHPSLLPDYKGLKTHERVIKKSEKFHGASVHAVNEFVDGGNVLCQGVVPVYQSDTPEILARRVMDIETIIYPKSIAAILSSKVKLVNGEWKINAPDKDFPRFDFFRKYNHPDL